MGKHIVRDTITQLFAGSKGLLAMDESNPTCNKRFALAGIPQTIISKIFCPAFYILPSQVISSFLKG